MPVVTALHTVLRGPNTDQRALMRQLDELSNRFIVMADRGKSFLQEIYGIAREKIDVIPHGIPDIPFIDPNFNKLQFGVEGKTVLLTFGLLSPNKGIEHVIHSLCSEANDGFRGKGIYSNGLPRKSLSVFSHECIDHLPR